MTNDQATKLLVRERFSVSELMDHFGISRAQAQSAYNRAVREIDREASAKGQREKFAQDYRKWRIKQELAWSLGL